MKRTWISVVCLHMSWSFFPPLKMHLFYVWIRLFIFCLTILWCNSSAHAWGALGKGCPNGGPWERTWHQLCWLDWGLQDRLLKHQPPLCPAGMAGQRLAQGWSRSKKDLLRCGKGNPSHVWPPELPPSSTARWHLLK